MPSPSTCRNSLPHSITFSNFPTKLSFWTCSYRYRCVRSLSQLQVFTDDDRSSNEVGWSSAYQKHGGRDSFIKIRWELVARYGVPLCITSDRGTQFQSTLFTELCRIFGTHQISTTAYNPKANGMIERINRQLKYGLRAHSRDKLKGLPMELQGICATPREDHGISSAEMTFGRYLIIPGEFFC